MSILFRCAAASVATLALCGCTKGTTLKTVQVTGKVTYKDQPLEGATVAFVKEVQAGEVAHPASGKTDAQGMYKLVSFESPSKPVDGVVPGKYKVTVTKQTTDAPVMGFNGMSPEEIAKKMGGATDDDRAKMASQAGGKTPAATKTGQNEASQEGMPKTESLIPLRYSNAKETDLEADVKESGAQTINFDLKE
jgi:hypothetical protein